MGERLPLELPSHAFLSQLAQEDPDGYESLRRQMIDELIDGAPDELKARLRGLQFRIDGVRRLAHTPLGSAVRVYSLMWQSFVRLNKEMSEFRHPPEVETARAECSARVIPFAPRGLSGSH